MEKSLQLATQRRGEAPRKSTSRHKPLQKMPKHASTEERTNNRYNRIIEQTRTETKSTCNCAGRLSGYQALICPSTSVLYMASHHSFRIAGVRIWICLQCLSEHGRSERPANGHRCMKSTGLKPLHLIHLRQPWAANGSRKAQ